MQFKSVARTHIGCRRKFNEDAVLDLPDSGLWAVADGMGGHAFGDVASTLVIEALAASASETDAVNRAARIETALQETNRRLVAMAAADSERRTVGATVVVLVADGGAYRCLWAGDSRAYRLRRGELDQITRDHSLVQRLIDIGELDANEAGAHPDANVVTRAVGADAGLLLDSVDGQLLAEDCFLLASDGLTRLVSSDELAEEMAAADIGAAADRLVALTLERGAPDNLSLVMIRADTA